MQMLEGSSVSTFVLIYSFIVIFVTSCTYKKHVIVSISEHIGCPISELRFQFIIALHSSYSLSSSNKIILRSALAFLQ